MPKSETYERIGRAQARRVRENPPEAPFGRKLSNKDRLKLSKAAAKNLIKAAEERARERQTTDSNN